MLGYGQSSSSSFPPQWFDRDKMSGTVRLDMSFKEALVHLWQSNPQPSIGALGMMSGATAGPRADKAANSWTACTGGSACWRRDKPCVDSCRFGKTIVNCQCAGAGHDVDWVGQPKRGGLRFGAPRRALRRGGGPVQVAKADCGGGFAWRMGKSKSIALHRGWNEVHNNGFAKCPELVYGYCRVTLRSRNAK
jgi:hypothetical protein